MKYIRPVAQIALVAAASLALFACSHKTKTPAQPVTGNGQHVVHKSPIGDFDSVYVDGNYRVVVKHDDHASVRMVGDENTAQYANIYEDDGILFIKKQPNVTDTKHPEIIATTPDEITKARADGNSKLYVSNPSEHDFVVIAKDNSTIAAKGATQTTVINASDKSIVYLSKLFAENAVVKGDKNSLVVVNAENTFVADVTDNAKVQKYGNAKETVKKSQTAQVTSMMAGSQYAANAKPAMPKAAQKPGQQPGAAKKANQPPPPPAPQAGMTEPATGAAPATDTTTAAPTTDATAAAPATDATAAAPAADATAAAPAADATAAAPAAAPATEATGGATFKQLSGLKESAAAGPHS